MDEETGEIPEEQEEDLTPISAYYAALRWAQADAPRIIKADDKHFDGYQYAAEKTYERMLVPILLKHGLVFELADVGPPEDLQLPTAKGGIQWMTTLEVRFRVTHAGSGYQQVYSIQGRRINDKDKGVSHAIASASKTFLQFLLQVRDAEDAPDNPVQQSMSAASLHAGDRPTEGKADPQPEVPRVTPAKRLELAKTDIKARLRTQRLRVYHLEALAQMDPNLPELLEEWGLADYEMVQEVLQVDPNRFPGAMRHMAEDYPTEADRVEKLKSLMKELNDQDGQHLDGESSILIADAIDAGWNDAVEWWIDKLNAKLKGQQGLDV